jgi:hypothetical protein
MVGGKGQPARKGASCCHFPFCLAQGTTATAESFKLRSSFLHGFLTQGEEEEEEEEERIDEPLPY